MTLVECLDDLEVALRTTKYPVRASGQQIPAGDVVLSYDLIADTDLAATRYLAATVEVQLDMFVKQKSKLSTVETRVLDALAGTWIKLRTNTLEYADGWHRQSIDIQRIRQEV